MEENPYDHHHHHSHYDVGSLPIPPLDLAGVDLPGDFSGDIAGDGDGFPFGVDFDFSFDDFSFADDLLLEPVSDLSEEDRSPNCDANRSGDAVRVYDCSENRSSEENRCGDVARVYDCSENRNLEENRCGDVARVYDCLENRNFEENRCGDDARVYDSKEKLSDDVARVYDCAENGNLEVKRSDDDVVRVFDCSSLTENRNLEENRSDDDVVRVYDCSSPMEAQNLEENRGDDVERVYDCSSEESNVGEKVMNCRSPEFGSCKSNSGVSHDSGNNSDRDVSSSSFVDCNSNNGSDKLDRKVKVEEIVGSGNNKTKCMSKRKKEQEQGDSNSEGRTSKFRRSTSTTMATESASFDVGNDDDEKRKARLMRNRESAQLSRQRKKQYVEELEDKVRAMHSTITDLNSKISYVMAENAALRQQMSSGGAGVCPPPHPGMYPMGPPMPYPWMPCPPYMVKPQGSQVPLVPIPRLKPQQPAPAPKISKKLDGKKTKKVASISFLGLLFFMLLFGGLVPMVNVRYGGGDGFSGLQKGTVLMVDNHVGRISHRVSEGKFGHGRVLQQSNSSDGGGHIGNSSEPLVASLYVPRNDKLVKIDGNLIIHSVLASEKSKGSHTGDGVKTSEETSLAIAGSYPPYPVPGYGRSNARHPHLDENPNGRQRALGSGFHDDAKAAGSDGKLQQWFREGLAGPMLSSGMCTEVFQFDISPVPGAIVPVTSIANTTSQHRQNSTRLNKPRNRRILHPIPLDDHPLNATEDKSDGLQSNKSRSSMVVSVLVDPREAGDGDGEGVIRSKTLSRIFVVVLIDSVKYVTYSCMLPFMGSGNHLVTT